MGADFSSLIAGMDFSGAITAVLAGFLLWAGLGLAVTGGLVVLRALGLVEYHYTQADWDAQWAELQAENEDEIV